MSIVGKKMSDIANMCYNKSQHTADLINNLNGFSIPYGRQFIKEFLVKTPIASEVNVKDAINENIFLQSINKNQEPFLLISLTEKRTESDIEQLIQFLKRYEK